MSTPSVLLRAVFVSVVLGLGCSSQAILTMDSSGEVLLGEAPLCEASGAVRAPWDEDLLLVADNEVSDRLFTFRRGSDGLLLEQGELMLDGDGVPRDIEGLAVAAGAVMLVGSHGRGGKCRSRPSRKRIAVMVPGGQPSTLIQTVGIDSAVRWPELVASVDACLEGLFTAPEPALARNLCEALVDAEHGEISKQCLALDMEGAATVTDSNGQERIWFGLRRPRVDDNAVLVRFAQNHDELRFDGVVLVDAARGIRSLAASDGFLWAILGPEEPDFEESSLWRLPLNELKPGLKVDGLVVGEGLPPSSEALLPFDGGMTVLTDGDEGPTPSSPCEASSTQVRYTLNERF